MYIFRCGHPRTAENSYHAPSQASPRCLTCTRERDARYKRRVRAEAREYRQLRQHFNGLRNA